MPAHWAFGPFSLDESRGVLLRAGVPVPLGHRAVALLAALVRADGAPLTKDELLLAAWPGSVVEDSNLSVQVAALRKALGTQPDGSEYVATVARVGYRFAAAIHEAGAAAGPPSAQPVPSVVVLPFVDLGGDAAQEWVADGLTEDVIMALSRFRWFRVIGRHASFAFKGQRIEPRELARKLGVRYALEGTVRRGAGRIGITVRLVDATDESQLWGERFDVPLDEAGGLHETIAHRVAGAVEPELLRTTASHAARRPTFDATVRDLVHRGTWLFHRVTRDGHFQARELFRVACREDPDSGEAQFWLARVSAGIVAYGWSDSPDADLAEGNDAAVRAIHLDERDPYAHYALAITSVYRMAFEEAARAADRAVSLAPGFALGHLVGGMARLFAGDARAAQQGLQRGLELNRYDPQNFVWFNMLAYAKLFDGDAAGALANARQAQEVRPDWAAALEAEACCLVAMGQMDKAREVLDRAARLPRPGSDALGPLRRAHPKWAAQVEAWLGALKTA